MEAYGVDPDEILRALPELLKDQALLWQRMNKDYWSTFEDFRRDFEKQFWPVGYQKSLDEAIRGRTQAAGEPFKRYMVALGTLIRRRGGLTGFDQLERVYANLRPEYKTYVRRRDFSNLGELQSLAEEYEALQRDFKEYQPPPDTTQQRMPNGSFRQQSNRNQRYDVSVVDHESYSDHNNKIPDRPTQGPASVEKTSRSKISNAGPQPRRVTTPACGTERNREEPLPRDGARSRKRTVTCWNCNRVGHLYRECWSPRRMRCYYCKRPDVKTTECGCKAENENRVQRRQGPLGPAESEMKRPLEK